MTSLALRIWTPWLLIPGTQSALSACWALAPNPEESARKCEVGEQSSRCQKPNPPLSGLPPSTPTIPPVPKPPPMPGLPPVPKLPATPPSAPVMPPVPVLGAGAAATAATSAGTNVVSPFGPIVVVPLGVPTTALVSGSVYSSNVCAANFGSPVLSAQPTAIPAAPAMSHTLNLPTVLCST